ncbi:hypothetical protein FLGE108171_14625 [Flavobacterium gelidilacus]|uniref:hypothetical protein n=1 Tax=Flavobacterium gelidilacus TaxID=206041 RepID=UPI000412519E|nr:hypothetical protein [Flavobacterium gelidilacus]
MNTFGLIIHGTTKGVDDLYVSENFKEIKQSEDIEKTVIDERNLSTKLANQSDVYTLQLTSNYRVYSLVVTDAYLTDLVGRAGFYAIRLYVPKKYPLPNIENFLQKINTKYLEFENNETPKENQNYDDLLKFDLLLEIKQQNFIHLNSNEDAFCYYNPINSNLSTVFNSKNLPFFKNVYAFNEEKALSPEIIKSLGLKSFNETNEHIKEVLLYNNDRVLKELKINNILVDFNKNETELNVLLKEGDVLEYNTTDEPKFQQGFGLIVTISKKYVAPPKPPKPPKSSNKPDFFKEYGIYILMMIMVVVIGYYSWTIFFPKPEPVSNTLTGKEIVPIEDVKNDTISTILFEIDSTQNPKKVYKTNYPKLEKYRFSVDNNKWSFKNTERNNTYVVFFKTNLDDIIKKDTLDFNDDKKKEFFKNLEDKAGVKIEEKEIVIETNKEASKKETVKQTSTKGKNENSTDTKQTPNKNQESPEKNILKKRKTIDK